MYFLILILRLYWEIEYVLKYSLGFYFLEEIVENWSLPFFISLLDMLFSEFEVLSGEENETCRHSSYSDENMCFTENTS